MLPSCHGVATPRRVPSRTRACSFFTESFSFSFFRACNKVSNAHPGGSAWWANTTSVTTLQLLARLIVPFILISECTPIRRRDRRRAGQRGGRARRAAVVRRERRVA